jgi:hypothetical protein
MIFLMIGTLFLEASKPQRLYFHNRIQAKRDLRKPFLGRSPAGMKIRLFYGILLTVIMAVSCNSGFTARDYYPSGALKEERIYAHRKDTAGYLVRKYFPNGMIRQTGNMVNGNMDGLWQGWYADGDTEWTAEFRDGRPTLPDSLDIKIIIAADPVRKAYHEYLDKKPVSGYWYAGIPKYLRIYVENVYPLYLGVAVTNARVEFTWFADSLNYTYNAVVTPQKPGLMTLRLACQECGIEFTTDTMVVLPAVGAIDFHRKGANYKIGAR